MEPTNRLRQRLGHLALGLVLLASFCHPGALAARTLALTASGFDPTISALKPQTTLATGTSLQLVVTGIRFGSRAKVQWNGTALATTANATGTVLTATVPGTDLASAGVASITVITGNGHVSAPAQFTVTNPAPVLMSVQPAPVTAGVLNVNGRGFVTASVVQWNGESLQTTYVSPTLLHATLTADRLQLGQTADLSIVNPAPGGGTSRALSVSEANPPPTLTKVTADSLLVYQQSDATLTLTGQYFVSGATVYWNGNALSTTYVSSTTLTAVAPAALFANPTPVTASVTMANPGPGGGTSDAIEVSDTYGVPQLILSIQPLIDFTAGSSDKTVFMYVSGVGPGPVPSGAFTIDWNGTPLPAQYGGSYTQSDGTRNLILQATIPATYLEDEAVAHLTVSDASGTSGFIPGYVIGSTLLLTSASPGSVVAGSPDYTLTLTGSGMPPNAQILWNGVGRSTTYLSPTQVQVQVGAADVAAPGTVTLQAKVPVITLLGHRRVVTYKYSNSLAYTIGPKMYTSPGTSMTTVAQQSNQMVSDRTHGVLYVSTSTPYPGIEVTPNCGMLLSIDPATGTTVSSIPVGWQPYTLAISDDDSKLYVGYPAGIGCNTPGASLVSRFSLPGPVGENLNWEPGLDSTADRPFVMAVEPGSPGTVAIMWVSATTHLGGVAVYDGWTPRLNYAFVATTGTGLGEGYLDWGSASTLFLGDASVGSGALKVMDVGSSGLSLNRSYAGVLPAFNVVPGFHYDSTSGYLFSDSGKVIDPATGATVTQLTMPDSNGLEQATQVLVDAAGGRVYMCFAVADPDTLKLTGVEIVSYDLSTFVAQGIYLIPTGSPSLRPTLVRWGAHGLALRDDASHIYLVQGDFIP